MWVYYWKPSQDMTLGKHNLFDYNSSLALRAWTHHQYNEPGAYKGSVLHAISWTTGCDDWSVLDSEESDVSDQRHDDV